MPSRTIRSIIKLLLVCFALTSTRPDRKLQQSVPFWNCTEDLSECIYIYICSFLLACWFPFVTGELEAATLARFAHREADANRIVTGGVDCQAACCCCYHCCCCRCCCCCHCCCCCFFPFSPFACSSVDAKTTRRSCCPRHRHPSYGQFLRHGRPAEFSSPPFDTARR